MSTDFSKSINNLAVLTVVLYDVIENYTIPVLMNYHKKTESTLFFFDGDQIKTLGTQFTPVTPEDEVPYDFVSEVPIKNERYAKYGYSLTQYLDIMPRPGNEIIMSNGSIYCPDMDPICLIMNAPRMAYHYCIGNEAPEDIQKAIMSVMSDPDKLRCMSDAYKNMKFIVRVRLDVLTEQMKDLVIAVKAIIEAISIPPPVKTLLDADVMTARNHIANLMIKRIGTIYMVPPSLAASMIRHAYTLVSGLVQALNYAYESTRVT
jgi:hypothetical protein